ncbi:hypothetical protein [Micromonospora sp. CPCC 205556]|uniref:hypothetical protein n=1 Tax=Micromonospora sp. CPCC 205556 TaxID=3122398 RepID=UPI002FF2C719
MTAAEGPPTIEFRASARHRTAFMVIGLLLVVGASVAFNLVRGRQWWDGLWLGLLCFAILEVSRRVARPPDSGYQARLPLRLTGDHVEVSGPDDITVTIAWSNIARAEIHGVLAAFLVIEPVDPDRTRPPLKRWQWAGHGQSRPHEILVPLAHLTPGRDVLRRELARRLPTDRERPPAPR